MIPVTDTAKEDLILVTAGVIALLLFFWLYAGFHPLSSADNRLGDTVAERYAEELLVSHGYYTDESPVTTFRTNSSILDSIQVQTDFNEFYTNPLYRSLFPVFYWRTNFLIEREDVGFQFGFPGSAAKVIEIHQSESGNLIGLLNSENIFPDTDFHHEALSYALGFDVLPAIDASADSLLHNRFQFQLTGRSNSVIDSTAIASDETLFLGRNEAEQLAWFYLNESNWPQQHFAVENVESVSINDINAATVTFGQTESQLRQSAFVGVTVLPAGNLLKMEYEFQNLYESPAGVVTIVPAMRAMFILFGLFWIFILLFMRFRLRLIDTKAAVLVAVLAGLIFPMILFLDLIHSQINSFGVIDFSFILMLMISIGFFAAMTSIGFFSVTAISDSITRQNWPEKLRTIDLLRVGQFFNIPVGLTLVRGISYGLIIAALWSITLMVVPNSYITVSSEFAGNDAYLPFISEILGNFAIYFLVAQVLFLIFIGQLRSATKSPVLIIITPAILLFLLNVYPFDVGNLSAEFATMVISGLMLGWIYWRDDFLTVFISLFVFTTLVSTSSGWLIQSSPDGIIFMIFMMLLLIGFVLGGYSIYKGKPVRELPDYIPEYVQELAREDRIKQELQIARKVQQSFLPVKTPDITGLDIAAICKPAYETGGDYYDFLTLDDGKLAITVGDVSGKGIEAAFYMTFIKGVLHALFNESGSTIDVLSKTNKLFRQNATRGTFISLIFGVFDKSQNTFCFSRAGHNPLLYFNSKKQKVYEFQPNGIAIGMADEDVFRTHITEKSIELSKGDIIILFTDGVVEAISKTNKVYGDRRLQNLIKNNHKLSSKDIIKKLETDLKKFGEKSEQHDDMTMIVIKKEE